MKLFRMHEKIKSSKTLKLPSIPQTRRRFLLSLFTPKVTSTLKNSGNNEIFCISSSCTHDNKATKISFSSVTFNSFLQRLTSSLFPLFGYWLIVFEHLNFRVVTKAEFTECVTAKKDISVLDRKNWSNLSQLVLLGSNPYCRRMLFAYSLLATLMVLSVILIPNIDETI